MAHYAILNENNIVTNVIVGKDESDIVLDENGQPIDWEVYYGGKRTSYNTKAGVHTEGGIAFRKNYAGVGFTYDSVRDAFIPPKPYDSWILNEDTCQYESPISYLNDGKMYSWNEAELKWEEFKETSL
jgi:hypothetical protein